MTTYAVEAPTAPKTITPVDPKKGSTPETQTLKTENNDAKFRSRRNERINRTAYTVGPVAATDAVALIAGWTIAFLLAPHLRPMDIQQSVASSNAQAYFLQGLLFVAVWLCSLWINKTYGWHVRMDARRGSRLFLRSAAYAAVSLAFLGCLFRDWMLLSVLVLAVPLGFVTMLFGRVISSGISRKIRRQDPSRILMVGDVEDIKHILGKDVDARFPLHTVTTVLTTDDDADAEIETLLPDVTVQQISSVDDLTEEVAEHACDFVWIASPNQVKDKQVRRLAWALRDMWVRLYVEPMLGGIEGTRISHERVGTRTVVQVKKPRINGANGLLKRFMDIFLSVVILIMISPVLIATAIAIKLEDGGPIFYKSTRVGLRGEHFKMWKFRSMYVDADKMQAQLVKEQGGGDLLFKMKDDPRVTKVGKFIRKTSIDELPQFFNSLNGTMSIVGPRPQVDKEVAMYNQDMRMRLEVKPGITGLWQVNGRSDLTPEQSENLDLYYVDNWSPWLDVTIFFRTFSAVLASRGAY